MKDVQFLQSLQKVTSAGHKLESNGPVPNPADFFDSSPEWPDTLEFLSVFARSFQKRFYFALFAAGYDTGGKGSRADFRVRLPCHKLGPQLLVNRDVVKSA